MPTPRIVLLVGLPGCGKSTWAAAQGHTTLSSDAIRQLLSDNAMNQSIHQRVFATMRYLLRQRLASSAKVTILDATHLERRWRRPWLQLARKYGARIEAVYFDTPLEVCLTRNRQRDRVVPDSAIRAMAAKLQPPSRDEGFERVRIIRPSPPARPSNARRSQARSSRTQ